MGLLSLQRRPGAPAEEAARWVAGGRRRRATAGEEGDEKGPKGEELANTGERFRGAADTGGDSREIRGAFPRVLLIPAEFFLLFLGIGGHVSGTFSIQVFFAFSDRPPGTPQKQRLPVNDNHNVLWFSSLLPFAPPCPGNARVRSCVAALARCGLTSIASQATANQNRSGEVALPV